MRETVIVSNRGQLTLPISLRKMFGIQRGGPVIIEDRDGEIVLKPAMVLEVEMYSDAQVAAWDELDSITEADRAAIRKRAGKKK